MLSQPERLDSVDFPDSIVPQSRLSQLPPHLQNCRGSLPGSPQTRHHQQMSHSQMVDASGSGANGGRVGKIEKLLARIKRGGNSSSTLIGGNLSSMDTGETLDQPDGRQPQHSRLRPSRSNPDISGFHHGDTSITGGVNVIQGGIAQYYQPISTQSPEHVLKVFKSDQSYKYLTVYRVSLSLILVCYTFLCRLKIRLIRNCLNTFLWSLRRFDCWYYLSDY